MIYVNRLDPAYQRLIKVVQATKRQRLRYGIAFVGVPSWYRELHNLDSGCRPDCAHLLISPIRPQMITVLGVHMQCCFNVRGKVNDTHETSNHTIRVFKWDRPNSSGHDYVVVDSVRDRITVFESDTPIKSQRGGSIFLGADGTEYDLSNFTHTYDDCVVSPIAHQYVDMTALEPKWVKSD
jgi:hypothetical protein